MTDLMRKTRTVIAMEVQAGENIRDVCRIALDLAIFRDMPVVFKFNERFIYAHPDDNWRDVIARYDRLSWGRVFKGDNDV